MEVPLAGSLVARSIKRPYHQQHHQESAAPFLLTGVQALLFDDDELAAFINSPAALLPWNGDQSLLIDRYDVRHLLQDLSGIRKRRPAPPLLDATEEELNYERYRDLEDLHSNHHGEGHQSPEGRLLLTPFSLIYEQVAFKLSCRKVSSSSIFLFCKSNREWKTVRECQ